VQKTVGKNNRFSCRGGKKEGQMHGTKREKEQKVRAG
jgi:hypothetical protein